MNKFNDILEQFAREVDMTVEIFDKQKDTPPVTKNQPPIAGAIKWGRALLARLKQTMAKLQMTEEEIIRTTGALVLVVRGRVVWRVWGGGMGFMICACWCAVCIHAAKRSCNCWVLHTSMQTLRHPSSAPAEIGQNVEAKFRAFARSVMLYEKGLFSSWSDSINAVAMQHLKQPIFRRNAKTSRVEVNFHGDLIELIRETRYLDRMGFHIPEIALNVALQVGAVRTCVCVWGGELGAA